MLLPATLQADILPPALLTYHTPVPALHQRIKLAIRHLQQSPPPTLLVINPKKKKPKPAFPKIPTLPLEHQEEVVSLQWYPTLLQVSSRLKLYNPTDKPMTLRFGMTDHRYHYPLIGLRLSFDGRHVPDKVKRWTWKGHRYPYHNYWREWSLKLKPKTSHTIKMQYAQTISPADPLRHSIWSYFPHSSYKKVGSLRISLTLHGFQKRYITNIEPKPHKTSSSSYEWTFHARKGIDIPHFGLAGMYFTRPSSTKKKSLGLMIQATFPPKLLTIHDLDTPRYSTAALTPEEQWYARIYRYWWAVRALSQKKKRTSLWISTFDIDVNKIPAQQWGRLFSRLSQAQQDKDPSVQALAHYLAKQLHAITPKQPTQKQTLSTLRRWFPPYACSFLPPKKKKQPLKTRTMTTGKRKQVKLLNLLKRRQPPKRKSDFERAFPSHLMWTLHRAAKSQCKHDLNRQAGRFRIVFVGLSGFIILLFGISRRKHNKVWDDKHQTPV